MKNKLKYLLGVAALFGTLVFAATSAYGCWIFAVHQRECPKSLLLKD
jgi:cyclic lactone autoinducer peptide